MQMPPQPVTQATGANSHFANAIAPLVKGHGLQEPALWLLIGQAAKAAEPAASPSSSSAAVPSWMQLMDWIGE
jgi:hypothetical protein